MGFADAYLHRSGLRNKLIPNRPHPDPDIIITIPAYNESGLLSSLDSLFQCNTSGIKAEVIVLINAASGSPAGVIAQNRRTYREAVEWTADHPHPDMAFHVLMDHSFGIKEAGVGMARKILMDEAVRRFNDLGREDGIIASMDADAVVDADYLQALTSLFRRERPDGCAVYFEHPLSGSGFSDETYRAVMQYELHQRYYLQSVRSTGYPHAFHTVGSSFAVRADVYCWEGGMNRRKGGEDFYFIQKVARRGNFSECNTTRVVPSPRASDRAPFGTGTVISRLLENPARPLLTYDPRPFAMLRKLFSGLDIMYTEAGLDHFMKSQSPVLLDFLSGQEFGQALVEIRRNTASADAFRKRFWRWFHMLRILKFLHHARQHGYPDIPVQDAAAALLVDSAASLLVDSTARLRHDTPTTIPSHEAVSARTVGAAPERTVGVDSDPFRQSAAALRGEAAPEPNRGAAPARTGETGSTGITSPGNSPDLRSLLEIYRRWDREGHLWTVFKGDAC